MEQTEQDHNEPIEGELVEDNYPDEIDLNTADLGTLLQVINESHQQVVIHANGMVHYAWRTGRALHAAKDKLGHGEWLPWLEANFDGSQQTAQRYMTLATNYSCVSDLDPSTSITSALKAIEPAKDRKPREKKEKKPEPTAPEFAGSKWLDKDGWVAVCGNDGRQFIQTADGIIDLDKGPVVWNAEMRKEIVAVLIAMLHKLQGEPEPENPVMKATPKKWTPEEDAIVFGNPDLTDESKAALLPGRTAIAVKTRRRDLKKAEAKKNAESNPV